MDRSFKPQPGRAAAHLSPSSAHREPTFAPPARSTHAARAHRGRTFAPLFVLLGLFSLVLCLWAAPAAQAAPSGQIEQLHELLSAWNTPEARRKLEPLLRAQPRNYELRIVHGRLLYLEGDYTNALRIFDELNEDFSHRLPLALKELRDEVKSTHDALKDFDEYSTEDGRFLIRYQPRDRLLLPYLVEVLQAADTALSEDFAYRPEGPVLVEIYPNARFLARVSPLTEKDIETSGTIALCKYNRLMFTSPRGLVRGYGWRDTVAHELVHYYVTRLSANTVPIWLHEGLAKFQESRWRIPPAPPLDPPQEDLLARSFEADQLVTFDQMHPSMAKLPSQEAAALAFAEVHMVVDYLYKQKGYTGLNTLLSALRQGKEMDQALRSSYGVDLDGLWTQWKHAMQARGFKRHPGLVQTSLKFKRPGQEEDPDDRFDADIDTIEEKRVRDLAHLGELLRARNRPKAAKVEYQKAMALGGDGNPLIQNGLASTLLILDEPGPIPEILARVSRYYPGYLKTWLALGEAWLRLDEPQKAREAFEQALGINPFHPRPHLALVDLYEALSEPQLAARARRSLELLK